MRDVRVGEPGVEVRLNGNHPEKEENQKGDPGADSGPFRCEKKNPESEQEDEKNPCPRKKRKVELSEVNTGGEDDEDRNERKAKDSTHLRLERFDRMLEKLKRSSEREFTFFRETILSERNVRKSDV